ncbi:60S ribosomal protein L20 [Mortierella sp. AD094]|nr:60S ribosomal protein L20 [Mortierella sp. AD094]
MTSVQNPSSITFARPFDNYRVNMRESLQREVEENIHKAKVLKEAMKESSDRDAEILISVEDEAYGNGSTTPNNRSNTSLSRQLQGQGQSSQSQQQSHQNSNPDSHQNGKPGNFNGASQEKRSRLDRFFGRKSSVNSNNNNASIRNHQVTPHPQPSSQHQTPSPSLRPANTLTAHGNSSTTYSNTSAADLGELKYLPVEEESEEEEVLSRSMGVHGSGVGGPHSGLAGTEVKLHPTRAKTFALPKSLRNLKRRIAALRAKGTDLDAEKREKEERERAANGGVAPADEKKKFTLIRLLPWRSSKKPAAPTTTLKKPTDSVISPSNTVTSTLHEYQLVGRHLPTEKEATPKLFRMRLFAPNEVVAKSRFWYFMRKLKKVKKVNGEIVGINEVSNAEVRRPYIKQILVPGIKFPLPHRVIRAADKSHRALYMGSRPSTFY